MSLAKPPRLERIFQKYDPPLYFITLCTIMRRNLLANHRVHARLIDYAENGMKGGIAVGRYVIMPDHVHLFVRGNGEFDLGIWVRGLKRVVAAAVSGGRSIWQCGFFDHVLRSSESYTEKWEYVWQNPVRAGLALTTEEWPFQGEIFRIEY